ncbi:MAG TPA: polysaccharide deacetylase family protein [Vineibacter sp.]|nr:polysaccharide deacetylase family protein [Vineibacter sp.]
MTGPLTIVMYHYVHEAEGRGHAGLVGRSFDEFQGQLDHIQRRYIVISPPQFFDAIQGRRELPHNACMLTFDDGYRIHYTVVYQTLRARGLCGFFFPPVRSALEPIMLDVHKIHFALASSAAPAEMARALCGWIESQSADPSIRPAAEYWSTYAKPSRFDPAEIVFIKRTLQKGLSEGARGEAVDWLFRRYSGFDEASLSETFYMRQRELADMVANGMYVGCHGYSHGWLDTMDNAGQAREVDLALTFLESVGSSTSNWIMCYPYGGLNEPLLALLRRRGCAAGVTTKVAVAEIGRDDPLRLPRLDTNDLPLCPEA